MAGNFWKSSHHQQWIVDKSDLIRDRQVDLQHLTEDEYTKVMIFFSNFIQVLGETHKLRQQVIATVRLNIYLIIFDFNDFFQHPGDSLLQKILRSKFAQMR